MTPEPGESWRNHHLKLTLKIHQVDTRRNVVYGWVGKQYVTRFLSHFDSPAEGWSRIGDTQKVSTRGQRNEK